MHHAAHPEAWLHEIMKATDTDSQEIVESETGTSSGNCSVCGSWSRVLLGDVCAHWSCRKMLRSFISE